MTPTEEILELVKLHASQNVREEWASACTTFDSIRAALDASLSAPAEAVHEALASDDDVIALSMAMGALENAYIDAYELDDGEHAPHAPTEFESLLIADAIAGLLADEEWADAYHAWDVARRPRLAALNTAPASPAVAEKVEREPAICSQCAGSKVVGMWTSAAVPPTVIACPTCQRPDPTPPAQPVAPVVKAQAAFDPVRAALLVMVHEAQRWNSTVLREAGVGPFDLVAIRQAEAALRTEGQA